MDRHRPSHRPDIRKMIVTSAILCTALALWVLVAYAALITLPWSPLA